MTPIEPTKRLHRFLFLTEINTNPVIANNAELILVGLNGFNVADYPDCSAYSRSVEVTDEHAEKWLTTMRNRLYQICEQNKG